VSILYIPTSIHANSNDDDITIDDDIPIRSPSSYSFNGFSGGLINLDSSYADGSNIESGVEAPTTPSSLTFKAYSGDIDNSSNNHKKRSLDVLPTVTVRGFLNFRTTVDGTVIVFTPSSSIPAPSSVYFGDDGSSTSAGPFSYRSVVRPTSTTTARPLKTHNLQPNLVAKIEPSPTSSSSSVYPTGLVSILTDSVVGDDGKMTIQETKVLGTFVDGKYAQVLKSTSYPKATPTPVVPTGTIGHSSFTRSHRRRPISFTPSPKDKEMTTEKSIEKKETDQPVFYPEENNEGISRVKIRRPGSVTRTPGRYTWNRPASERARLNRFKVKLSGNKEESTTPLSERMSTTGSGILPAGTRRDEVEKEAAKLLNQRLNRRLGVTRGAHLSTSYKKATGISGTTSSTASDEGTEPTFRSGEVSLSEGLLSEASSSGEDKEEVKENTIKPSSLGFPAPLRVITETQTVMSEVTRGFVDGEPLLDTVTLTTTIERTVSPTDGPLFEALTSPSPILPLLPMTETIEPTPPIVLTKTFTLTESSLRTSLIPVTDGPVTATATITESFLIRKMITAYKTIPGGDRHSALVDSLLSEMNGSEYIDNLIASENAIEPTLFQGSLDITPTPQLHGGVMSSTALPSLDLAAANTLLPSINSPTATTPINPAALSAAINSNFGPQIDLNNPLVLGAALQNPALAAMYFGLQQLSQQATQYSTILKPTDVTSTETIYATKTISFYDGRATRTRTITEPGSTSIKVIPTVIKEVQPVINPQVLVQQAQLQRAFASQLLNGQNGLQNMQTTTLPPIPQPNFGFSPPPPSNPFLPQQPQPSGKLVSETVTKETMATSTSTKVYTLIYNAFSTKYRTVTSSSVYPTKVTEVITKTITPTQGFAFYG